MKPKQRTTSLPQASPRPERPRHINILSERSRALSGRVRATAVLLVALLALPDMAIADRKARYWPTRRMTAQNAGISLLLPSSADPVPLPAIEIFPYTRSDTGERIDMYRPRDLWLRSQHIARWRDEFGNEVRVAKMTLKLPTAFPREHASQEEYNDALAREDSGWDTDAVRDWVSAYMEAPASPKPEQLDGLGTSIRAYLVFRDENRVGYAVLFRGNKTRYFVAFLLQPESMQGAAKGVRKSLISMEIERPEEGKNDSPSSVFQSRRVDRGNRSAEFKESRKRVFADIRNLDGWWFAETENYIVASDMEREDRRLAKQIQEDIETLRQVYSQLAEPWEEPNAVSVVKVFGERENYVAYVGKDQAWSGGLWIPLRKELVVSPVSPELEQFNEEAVMRTVYHEGFHQYLFYALNETRSSAWFNEGHAVLMEGCEVRGRRARLSEHPIFTRIIDKFMDDADLQIRPMLTMTYDDFYRADGTDNGRLRNYVTAWGIVYYLQKACSQDRKSPYRNVVENYLKALRKTRNPDEATEKAFEDLDLAAFSKDCNEFWRSSSQRKRASRNRILDRIE